MPKLRVLPVVRGLTAVALVLSGRRLRERVEGLPTLDSVAPGDVDTSGWRVVGATGVELDPDTVAAAVAWAETQGLDAVDLVPGDLPVARALDLLRQLDTATYRSAPTAQGRTAGHALVVRADLAERAELPTEPQSPAAMVDVARQVKRFAPRTHDLVVAPAERAATLSASEQLAVQRTVFDRYGFLDLAVMGTQLAVLGTGLLAPGSWWSRALGLAAWAAYEAQPALVFGDRAAGLAPRDLTRGVGTRGVREAARLVGLLRADAPRAKSLVTSDELRPAYAAEAALGTDRFFEAPVDKCRWCGSTEIGLLLTTPDLIQHKPGTFRLDECASCGHVFQNPRLSPEGLEYYYRDCYDGFGEAEMERVFATESTDYEGRAAMVQAHDPAPARWLDVGSGHAHFCLVARASFPDTSFEALDLGDAVDEAARRGWVDRSHRGLFPEVAPELAGQFDVVSMLHYLEHTREPAEELDAAATALKPDGLLMVEVPNPDCPSGRLLGRYWMPWLQPQHQQFVSLGRLRQALEERGFTVLECETMAPSRGFETVAAGWLLAGHLAPRLWMPWRRRPTTPDRVVRAAAVSTALPAAVVLGMGSEIAGAITGDDTGNAFRVLARLDRPSE